MLEHLIAAETEKCMKKAICLLLVAVCVLSLSACGKKPVISTEAPTTSVINLMPDGSIIVGELTGDPYAQYTSPDVNAQTTAPVVQQTVPATTEAQIGWIIDVYNTVYNNTKADANFLGSDSIVISDIMVDGVKNSGVDSIVHSVMDAVYKPQHHADAAGKSEAHKNAALKTNGFKNNDCAVHAQRRQVGERNIKASGDYNNVFQQAEHSRNYHCTQQVNNIV